MFTKSEQKRLLKMKSILEEIWDGKIKKYKVTINQAHLIADVYNQIVNGKTATTIDNDVKNLFMKYGFHIEENGVGWIITM